MRIAMFGHKTIPSREGGVEIVVQELSSRLVKNGYDVICYNRRTKQRVMSNKNYEGVRLKQVPTINMKGLAAVTSSFFAALFSSFGKYDIVHIHAEGPSFWCWLPKFFGKNVIITIHGLDWNREKWRHGFGSKFIRQGERNAVKYADSIIVLSRNVQKYFKDFYNRETCLIPNGVDCFGKKEANKINEMFGLKLDSYILFLGRLVPEKGIHYLIDAFRSVNTDKKLIIAGGSSDTDSYVKSLMDLAKEDERIVFVGHVEGQMLAELYSNAYLYVLPSDLEGMPLSLLEAMSYGNCCLVSDIPECVEVVEGKALVFKRSDVEDLKDKLEYACGHPEIVAEFKESSSGFICKKYDWDNVVDETLKLYEKSMVAGK